MRHARPRHFPRAAPSLAARAAPGLSLAAAALLLGACDWVDATGRQPGDDAAGAVPVMLDQIAPGEALVLNEGSSARLDLSGSARAGDVYAWSEEPLAAGALDSCAGVPGFRPALAAASLAEACATDADCRFAFERDPSAPDGAGDDTDDGESIGEEADDAAEGGGTDGLEPAEEALAFVVAVPTLRASIGLRHRLSVTTADGTVGSSTYDFCLVAINEAPEALDDGPFVVMEGTTLVVGPDDPNNLLANDTDDDDVGNAPLRVETVPVRAPSAGDAFELGADGGFSYTFAELGIRGTIVDSFEYVVTDGLSSSAPATVRLTIVPRDLPPVLARPIEPLEARVGERFLADLSAGFSDPEGGVLSFALVGEPLPPSGSLSLDEDGVLSGVPVAADVGDYTLDVVASDGLRETTASVTLSIVEPPNAPPVYVAGSIGDIVLVRNRFMTPRTAGFVDPEDEPLTFELVGELPRGLRFDAATGTLSGRPTQFGDFTGLRIVASDPRGASASSVGFAIQVI